MCVCVCVCVCACVCVYVCVRVCVTQELASRERFIIAFILCGRMSDEQEHDSTDPFAIVRMYECACVYTCVHVCVCVSLTNKDMVRLIRSSARAWIFPKEKNVCARVSVCIVVLCVSLTTTSIVRLTFAPLINFETCFWPSHIATYSCKCELQQS